MSLGNRTSRVVMLVAAAVLLACGPVLADVKPAGVFGDHMVLQRERPVPVWGTAAPGEKVTVQFAGQTRTATACKDGRWRVNLAPLKANAIGNRLTIAAANTVTIKNVLVGEVWLCSGQSNMEWPLRGSLNAAEEIAAAKYPSIRLFNVPGHVARMSPQTAVSAPWAPCTPASATSFSAVGYFFGRRLWKELGVPIGLIGSNWGGTRIEPWTPLVGFKRIPELKDIVAQISRFDLSTPAAKAAYAKRLDDVEAWLGAARKAVAAGKHPNALPQLPRVGGGDPTAIYNGMVHPMVPFAMRGAIWYQGESNGSEGESYYHKTRALVEGWREVFENPELAYYLVQLADFRSSPDSPAGGDGWAMIREAQRKCLTIPHTGMAVITDIGAARDIHPKNKQDVGYRLAQWALHQTYGKAALVPSGPLYKSMKVEGKSIRLAFDHVGSGLMVGERKQGLAPTKEVVGGKLGRFAIAGSDKKWYWADAKIDGDAIVVSCKQVPKPVAVRYGYCMNPVGANLYNKEGLPASPFRTDKW